MKKITSKKKLLLYGCSGMGVNMLTLMVGSYLCSALLVGGFDEHIESFMRIGLCLLQRDDLALAADEAMLARSRASYLLCFLVENRIFDIESYACISGDLGADDNRVAVLGHGLVFSGKAYDGTYNAHLLHALIA